jgi:hypothetical protein
MNIRGFANRLFQRLCLKPEDNTDFRLYHPRLQTAV